MSITEVTLNCFLNVYTLEVQSLKLPRKLSRNYLAADANAIKIYKKLMKSPKQNSNEQTTTKKSPKWSPKATNRKPQNARK